MFVNASFQGISVQKKKVCPPCYSQGIEKIKKNCKVNIVTVVISHSGGGRGGWQGPVPLKKIFSAFFLKKYLKF